MAKALAESRCFDRYRWGDGVCGSNDGPSSLLQIDRSLFGQLPVGLSDGVEVDSQLGCEASYRGQRVAGSEGFALDVHAHLIDDLPVDGDLGFGGEFDFYFGHTKTVCFLYTVSSGIRWLRTKKARWDGVPREKRGGVASAERPVGSGRSVARNRAVLQSHVYAIALDAEFLDGTTCGT